MDHEREVSHDPQVLEGDDEIPRQPADRDTAADAFEPEAPPTAKARTALWLALLLVLVVVLVVVILALAD